MQFFRQAVNVCGLSLDDTDNHFIFQKWNSSSIMDALGKSLEYIATACSMSPIEEADVSFIGSATCLACLLNVEERSHTRWSRKRTMTVLLNAVLQTLFLVLSNVAVLMWHVTWQQWFLSTHQACSCVGRFSLHKATCLHPMQAYSEAISWFSPRSLTAAYVM